MKKTLNIIVVICLCILVVMLAVANQKINSLQNFCDTLSEDLSALSCKMSTHISEVAPLTALEVETFQHNLDTLNEFWGVASNRPIAIANKCLDLKREGKMESARIISINKHAIPENQYYCIEITTEDHEHYWFQFYDESTDIVAIFKGSNKETLLYAEEF